MQGHKLTITRLMLSTLAALVLTACSSSPPKPEVDFKQDYNFMAVSKIAFYKNSGQVSGDNPMQLSDMQRNRADTALRLALEQRGYTFTDNTAEADLLLSWHLATQNKTDVRTYQSSPSYGYGPYNRYSRYNCWSCMQPQTEVSVSNYTEGTFIVDLIDTEMGQSVWRGVTQSRLKDKPQHEQEAYNRAAEVIFESFPMR
jgi:Domain of unknown function (DUF4136)